VTGHALPHLCTLDERLVLLRGLGLDLVVVLPFAQDLAQLPALDFMSLLCESVRLRELWVGLDFALGYGREGTVARLTEIGLDLGYRVHGVPPFAARGKILSSTLIRGLVAQGDVEAAARLLARPHHVSGMVRPQGPRHRHVGFPAATVDVSDGLAVPASGVYAACVRSGHRQWSTTVRVEPNRAETARRPQAWLSNVPDDLYGQSLRVEFVHRLQPGVPAKSVRAPMGKVLTERQVPSPA
jgi:riboflavin kinase/FMN adenylyltransferase